jgi:hypothetical protein
MYYTLGSFVGLVDASSSKYPRSGRKFEINVSFGWFLGSFRNTSSQEKIKFLTTAGDQNRGTGVKTGSEQVRYILFLSSPGPHWHLLSRNTGPGHLLSRYTVTKVVVYYCSTYYKVVRVGGG